MIQSVPESISFPDEEEKTLLFWTDIDAFKTSLKQSENKPRFLFADGPPFSTGLPHYGHILAGTIKDIVTRWAHQSGFHVERRFGWDCHGLPIEYEIDKMLGIKGPEDVKKMGIAAYNAECRKIINRYSNEWRSTMTRMARWIDFDNDYKTMYPWFMESVWWVFKQLYIKSLVYRGVKVMPYSTQCNTPISNFESGQNYKEVVDPAVVVSFPLVSDKSVSLIAWTTTPWTLPSNLALCVNPNSDYLKVECVKTNKKYIVMESRVSVLFKKPTEYKVIEKLKGKQLEGEYYVPLFDYFVDKMKANGAFRVLTDNYVTEDSGTGIVHQAPYFGEDDHRVCLANRIILKESSIVCPVDESGKFTKEVTHFAGLYVKDADKEIIKHLKKIDRLVSSSTVKHNYPFCWRSDTPLIYKAVPSWFVKVEQMSQKLLKNNAETYWVPDFVKEKRFGNWLRDARDWAVSRNRYWGTPIPLWISDDGEEIICVGSIQELEELSGTKVTDLHREFVDSIEIPSKMGKGKLKRVSEVFDCWFESGSMPYAQNHYPFENKSVFEKNFPFDFIAEGIDQTRGWFYTLLVLSTALFDKPPFKNLIANGMVLAADGQKMSKRKKNYPDPMELVKKYGADAIRLYLVNSPVVRAENLRFKEEGVRDVLKDCFLPWYNAYRFLIQNIELYTKKTNEQFQLYSLKRLNPENFMDKWILSFTQSLVKFVKAEMKLYHLYTVTPKLVKFIDDLTNWYVRMNRKRLKGESVDKIDRPDGEEVYNKEDAYKALETLASVLSTMVQLMAPFTPYLTELMYQNLKNLYIDKASNESIHYLMLPDVQEFLIDKQVEQCVSSMQSIVDVGRVIRDRRTMPLKYPLPEAIVICKEQALLDQVKLLENYIIGELNIKKLVLTTEKDKYGVKLRAEPNTKNLGIRLRNKSKEVAAAIRNLSEEEIVKFVENPNEFTVCGDKIEPDDIRVQYSFAGDLAENLAEQYEADAAGPFLVLLDVRPDSSMLDEGVAREVVNRIQKLRKKAHLVPTDQIEVYYSVQDEKCELNRVIQSHTEFIMNSLKAPLLTYPLPKERKPIIEESQELKEICFKIGIIKLNNESSKPDQVC